MRFALSERSVLSPVKNVLPKADVRLQYIGEKQCVLLNGKDVTDRLRTEEVGNIASKVSAYPSVRNCLAGLQRRTAEENDVVMDGRDIGTVILPNAPLKVFLTASVSVRAKRRFLELKEKGVECEIHIYGDAQTKAPHVFHLNMKSTLADQCNDGECAFFRAHSR